MGGVTVQLKATLLHEMPRSITCAQQRTGSDYFNFAFNTNLGALAVLPSRNPRAIAQTAFFTGMRKARRHALLAKICTCEDLAN